MFEDTNTISDLSSTFAKLATERKNQQRFIRLATLESASRLPPKIEWPSKDRSTHTLLHNQLCSGDTEHALDEVTLYLVESVPVERQDIVSRFTMHFGSATDFLFKVDVRSFTFPSRAHPRRRATSPSPRPLAKATITHGSARRGFMQSYLLFEFWGDREMRHLGEGRRFMDSSLGQAPRGKAARRRPG
ncbi:hypothetical protein V8D89_005183 [Ganoderma adspersum]